MWSFVIDAVKLLSPAICADQDLVVALARRHPRKTQQVLQSLAKTGRGGSEALQKLIETLLKLLKMFNFRNSEEAQQQLAAYCYQRGRRD